MTTGKEIIVRMFAVAVAMGAAVSHADTVAWWHFDEEAPGTVTITPVAK